MLLNTSFNCFSTDFKPRFCTKVLAEALSSSHHNILLVVFKNFQVTSRKCSYGWFTKVNTKSHNSSFHPYNLLCLGPAAVRAAFHSCTISISKHFTHTHTHLQTHTHEDYTHVPGARYKYYTSYSHSAGKFPFSLDLS